MSQKLLTTQSSWLHIISLYDYMYKILLITDIFNQFYACSTTELVPCGWGWRLCRWWPQSQRLRWSGLRALRQGKSKQTSICPSVLSVFPPDTLVLLAPHPASEIWFAPDLIGLVLLLPSCLLRGCPACLQLCLSCSAFSSCEVRYLSCFLTLLNCNYTSLCLTPWW